MLSSMICKPSVYAMMSELGGSQEQSCTELVKRLLKLKKATIVTDGEIALANFKKMNMTVFSAWHKPDGAIYVKCLFLLILEVHSCGEKVHICLLGMVGLLRYHSFQTVTSCKGLVVQ